MQALRNASFLARLVLAWFALSLGVAMASPALKPAGLGLICSGGGIVLAAAGDDGGQVPTGHTLECPLCVGLGAPPPAASGPTDHLLPLARAVQSIPSARIAALIAAPLPARGPPPPLFL